MTLSVRQLLTCDAPKLLSNGSHRTRTPEETLARLRPHFEKMGISRVGLITGLDRVGFPVAQAVRPCSKSMIVSQGKGRTIPSALVSAAIEAAEQWHGENLAQPVLSLPRGELTRSVRVMELGAYDLVKRRPLHVLNRQTIRWVAGQNVRSGQQIYVPLDLVDMDYTCPQDTDYLVKSSAGLGAGNTPSEALCVALLELIERDATAEFRALDYEARAARRVKPDLLNALGGGDLVRMIRSAKINLDVWDTTSDIGIPSYWAAVTDMEASGQGPSGGAGCHLDPNLALDRAISEALQTRLTFISGAREDISESRYDTEQVKRLDVVFAAMFETASAASSLRADLSRPSASGDVEVILEHLSAAGLEDVYAVDLSHPEIGLPVVRAIVPKLGLHLAGNTFLRGMRIPRTQGELTS